MTIKDLPPDVQILVTCAYHLTKKAVLTGDGYYRLPTREFERLRSKSSKVQSLLKV
jgi:hypothetical protein